MSSFSQVAEALTGLIYHRPSGENFSSLRVRSNESVASDRPPGWSCKSLEVLQKCKYKTKKLNSEPCFRQLLFKLILHRSASLVLSRLFTNELLLYPRSHRSCPDLPLKMEAVVPQVSPKAEPGTCAMVLFHLHFHQPANMADRWYLKYLERSLQVTTGLS